MDRFRDWLKEWQDGVLWLPIAFAIFFAAWWWLPKLDPRSGIDGLGTLFALSLLVLKGIVCVFMAWLCKRTYTRDWGKLDELGAQQEAHDGRPWVLIIDRLEWAGWVGFWLYCLSH